MRLHARKVLLALCSVLFLSLTMSAEATPANRIALSKHFGTFMAKRLDNCTTCHLPGKKADALQTSLKEFPHNSFGDRLRRAAGELSKQGKKMDIATRMRLIAKEDSDGDGVDNQTELLLGHAPGDPNDRPTAKELKTAAAKRAEFTKFLASYRWQPFDPVKRPPLPVALTPGPSPNSGRGEILARTKIKNQKSKIENPIDVFLAAEWVRRGLKPRPEAPKHILLRRLYVDLIGLNPTPAELLAFENDRAPDAYERVVDRLLADPRYGERWARHWMDVWRYSDWAGWADGGQIRDSKPHIWRWRDWIIESLNKDKGYDRMVQEMLAADELAPEDTDALRATGFLVRNFKLLSREQWLEDTVGHTAKAFLGVTMHCAKCHDHMYDPVSQADYYRMRAVFEPHNVRTDKIPGELDTAKNGLVRAYDADIKAATYFFPRGDERNPDKDRPMTPGVPPSLGGALTISEVKLPRLAAHPDRRDFVIQDTIAASEKAVETARAALTALTPDPSPNPGGGEVTSPPPPLPDAQRAGRGEREGKYAEAALNLAIAETKHVVLLAQLKTEEEDEAGRKSGEVWTAAAKDANTAQRLLAVKEAEKSLLLARRALSDAQAKHDAAAKGTDKNAIEATKKARDEAQAKVTEAEKAYQKAEEENQKPVTTEFKPRPTENFPEVSSGRRLAFARWLTETRNPLTARVAVNHIWTRHFGQGLVPSVADFGRNGRAPSHPQLLDWLAAEFMEGKREAGRGKSNGTHPSEDGWSMKHLHRLIVTSRAYRMVSTPDPANLKKDPDNIYLWRMSSRRLEAEAVRDNVLYVSGDLDATMGGPEVDHTKGLESRRRSVYLRIAAEKEVEFLKIFDGPNVTECYERKPSVMPQQALALANSALAIKEAKLLTEKLTKQAGSDAKAFTQAAFLQILVRRPTAEELRLCLDFLKKPASTTVTAMDKGKEAVDPVRKARENLILVLFNHNDFVTVR